MYTWRDLDYVLNNKETAFNNNIKHPIDKDKILELVKYVDIVVDGEFDATERLYKNNSSDGFYGSIGSGNQKVWDTHAMTYESMRDITGLKLDENNELVYLKGVKNEINN